MKSARLEVPGEIEKAILEAFIEQLNSHVVSRLSSIEKKGRELLDKTIKESPTYEELINGRVLPGELGFPIGTGQYRVDTILERVADFMYAEFTPFRASSLNTVNGSINLYFLKKDLKALFGMSEAIVVTEKQRELPWLKWMLEDGDKILIAGWDVHFEDGQGRSGLAVMWKSNYDYRLSEDHQGNINNNWLTRAFEQDKNKFGTQVAQLLKAELM